MKTFFFFILVTFKIVLFAQNAKLDDINFIVKKIKNVYAGYKDKVISTEFDKLVKEIKLSKQHDTFALFSRLTLFFQDHHLALYQKKFNKDIDSTLSKKNLQNLFKSKNTNSEKKYEGYWINELNNQIIFLTKSGKDNYTGYIIESKNGIPAGHCILKLYKDKEGKRLTDYTDIDGEFRVFTKSYFKSPSILVGNSFFKWYKIVKYYPNYLYSRLAFTKNPGLIMLDSNNIVIKMHDFSTKRISKFYDSLIRVNARAIANCKNLIIDMRNNGGGTINSIIPLLRFICNKPIIQAAAFQLNSNELIEEAELEKKIYVERKDTARVAIYDKMISEMQEKKNEFIYIPPDTLSCNPVQSKVKNVGLIINHGCRSAAELVILYLKQIEKTKTFGENTAGAVDYLNLLTYKLPRTNYTFWVGTAKREITDKQPGYDNTGIKPDVQISDKITDWITFVKKYYE
jgi:hypothetical protein